MLCRGVKGGAAFAKRVKSAYDFLHDPFVEHRPPERTP
jgi:hypothetical protein